MKTLLVILISAASPALLSAGALDELMYSLNVSDVAEIPAPPLPVLEEAEVLEKAVVAACPSDMRGDRSVHCVITTKKTTVCSDGDKISTARVTAAEVAAGTFPRHLLGHYRDANLRKWAEHQAKVGGSDRWGDGSHQSVLATGKANPFTTRYVVLPNRSWLGRKVKVCLTGTKTCTEAQALEVGPSSTFRTHSEVSVSVLMDLGLNAHPNSGTYNGQMTFSFQ